MNIYVYIAAMAITTYLIRMLPLTIFRKPIKSRFLRSFLYYVPYACLTAMTFPSILSGAGSLAAGIAALIVAVVLSYMEKSLIVVALSSSAAVSRVTPRRISSAEKRPLCRMLTDWRFATACAHHAFSASIPL